MKAKIRKTCEIVDVYHVEQHGCVSNIYRESVLVNSRTWNEDELEFYEEREKDNCIDAFIEKACDAYCEVCGHYQHTVPTHICRQDCDYYKAFRNYMKGE